MQEDDKNIEIDLLQLLSVIWHKAWIVVLAAVIGAAAAFSISYFFITPMYSASVMLYVNNNKTASASESVTAADLSASQSLVDTYIVVLGSKSVLEEVVRKADVDYTWGQVSELMSASAVNNTEMMSITFTTPEPKISSRLANTTADISADKMMETVDGSSVKIVDYANVPSDPSSPNIKKNSLIGLLIGIVLSVGAILLMEMMDTQIRSESQLSALVGNIPVLGVIPSFDQKPKKGYGHYGYGYGYGYESEEARQ